MDLKSAIAIILKDLGEARTILEELKSHPGAPLIQLELARGKCRSAEEVLKLLAEMDFDSGKSEVAALPEMDKRVEPGESTPEQDLAELREEDGQSADPGEAVPDTAEPILELNDDERAEDDKVDEATLIDEIIQPRDVKSERSGSAGREKKGGKIVADTFTPKAGINERMSGGRKDAIASDSGRLKPVDDLSKAIGLNDRFLFVREIFRGDAALYSETINRLNDVTSVDEADEIIEAVRDREADRSAADQLLDLVRRKLTKL